MSLCAVVDFIVNLEKFRNVDLVQQGYYRISVRVQGLHSGTQAVPLAIYPSERKHTLGCDDAGEIPIREPGLQSFIDATEKAYVTRPFFVRYNDHTACLCEMAHFRLELDCSKSIRELEDVLVRFDLQFAVKPTTAAETLPVGPPKPEDYSVISTHDFHLCGSMWLGANHSVPLTFEEHSVCWSTVTLHAVLSDVRFISVSALDALDISPSQQSEQSSPRSSASIRDMPDSLTQVMRTKLGLPSAGGGEQRVPMVYANSAAAELVTPLLASLVGLRSVLCSYEHGIEGCTPLGLPESVELAPMVYSASEAVSSPRRRTIRIEGKAQSANEVEAECSTIWNRFLCSASTDSELEPESGGSEATVSTKMLVDSVSNVMHGIAVQIFRSWHALLMLCQAEPHGVAVVTHMRAQEVMHRRFELSVLRAPAARPEALLEQPTGRVDEEQLQRAAALRNTARYQAAEEWTGCYAGATLHDTCMPAGTATSQHIMFEESYTPQEDQEIPLDLVAGAIGSMSNRGRVGGEGHVFVFCHGFQGNQYDLRYFRNRIGIAFPRARLLCCSSDEDHTHKPIEEQGIKIADEVARYISGIDDPSSVYRLSFVGHSLGTLVIRAALAQPVMAPYANRLHTLISLGGTHLGYTFANNNILSGAMWFYQRWAKSSSLQQLIIKDADTPEKSYLYSLAQKSALANFKHVVLVGSGQDRYAPFYSARMQIAPTASDRNRLGAATSAMVRSLVQPIISKRRTQVTRLSVCFGGSGAFLDEAIGRAAHIQFLEDHTLIHMLISHFAHLMD
jgi:pimeloyl-ACP methyl ester carboxylesterase